MLFESPPSGGAFQTVSLTVRSPNTPVPWAGPWASNGLGVALLTAAAGTVAFSSRGLTKVVGTVSPLIRITELLTKPTPRTTTSKSELPSTTVCGAISLNSGSGVAMAMLRGGCVKV